MVSAEGVFATKTADLGINRIVGFNFMGAEAEATVDGHIESLTLAEPYIRKPYPEIYVTKDRLRSIFRRLEMDVTRSMVTLQYMWTMQIRKYLYLAK